MQLTSQQKLVIGTLLAGMLFFLLGLGLTVLHILDGNAPEGSAVAPLAHGKPRVEDARRTPEDEDDHSPDPPPAGQQPPRAAPSAEASTAWVIQDGAKAHDTPTTTGPTSYTLRYGDKVRPMDRRGSFDRVLLPNGRPGWVPTSMLSNRRPADLAEKGPGDAVKVVDGFYQDISNKRYSSAYDRLSFEWKRALDFTRFAAGYAETESADCQVTRCLPADADHVQVQVQVTVNEHHRRYLQVGSYQMVREKGDWKLDSGDLREKPVDEPRGTPDDEDTE